MFVSLVYAEGFLAGHERLFYLVDEVYSCLKAVTSSAIAAYYLKIFSKRGWGSCSFSCFVIILLITLIKMWLLQDFTGNPVASTPHFQCRGAGLIPGWGTKISDAASWHDQKLERKINVFNKLKWDSFYLWIPANMWNRGLFDLMMSSILFFAGSSRMCGGVRIPFTSYSIGVLKLSVLGPISWC